MTNETLKLLGNISVLIVEDDDIALETLYDGLSPYCKSVYIANDGYKGLEKFNKFNADIILADIHLPIMNGFEMMKQILKIKPSQNFIIITSYDTDINLLKSLQHGATLFLKKPLDIEELRTALITLTHKNENQIINISKNLSVNLAKEKIYHNGEEIYLTFSQNKLFWLLVYNLNSLVTYDMIEDFVYENEPVSKNTIQHAISRLKKYLNINIKNIFESGYMLNA
ncbi:response regulator transcription factor [Campylobacter sp. faydin G-24]|uniref:Response regulator transcription factor n=1 Tax=Campylobacter anatolicus TaxID=2829105 RepID=A0ABS5HJA6_9BACT|nr:response regulator transcription factor [Campylobacter anatolicus]MBR8461953.1 response regulator transcription factor [Campylobacter anatolicus]MBR8464350.1 response regulator transcription factor [Campylobacter anatolicus]MBR8464957.1 response regulator transcription factor [Campylobacter anatolicus]